MTFKEVNYRESDKIGRLWEADIELGFIDFLEDKVLETLTDKQKEEYLK